MTGLQGARNADTAKVLILVNYNSRCFAAGPAPPSFPKVRINASSQIVFYAFHQITAFPFLSFVYVYVLLPEREEMKGKGKNKKGLFS